MVEQGFFFSYFPSLGASCGLKNMVIIIKNCFYSKNCFDVRTLCNEHYIFVYALLSYVLILVYRRQSSTPAVLADGLLADMVRLMKRWHKHVKRHKDL